jgi:hypothetical protein
MSYLSDFIAAYKEAAEWSTSDTDPDTGEDAHIDGMCLEWSPEADEQASEWCKDFIEGNRKDLDASGLSADSAGHDFWLTSAGHGAGFWDRGLGDVGQRLSKASNPYAADLYVGDDRKLHLA